MYIYIGSKVAIRPKSWVEFLKFNKIPYLISFFRIVFYSYSSSLSWFKCIYTRLIEQGACIAVPTQANYWLGTSSLNTSASCLYLFLYQTSQIINFINQPSGPNLNTSVSFVNLKKTNQCNLEGKLRKLVKSGPRQCQLTMVSQYDDGRSISLWQLIVLKEINNDNIRSSNAFCCKLKNEDDFLFLKLPARWLWRVRWASQPN